MQPGSSAPRMADSDVPRHKLSAIGNGREPVTFHGLDEQREDHWDNGRLTSSTERVASAAAVESSKSAQTSQESTNNPRDCAPHSRRSPETRTIPVEVPARAMCQSRDPRRERGRYDRAIC